MTVFSPIDSAGSLVDILSSQNISEDLKQVDWFETRLFLDKDESEFRQATSADCHFEGCGRGPPDFPSLSSIPRIVFGLPSYIYTPYTTALSPDDFGAWGASDRR
jgi:hypothetical protein